ncbi:MAG TPA: hypothetical protein VGE96_05530 [Steroidobacteraceae bacterium]|jgi:hypothetical protein
MQHDVRCLRARNLARCALAGALPVLGVLLLGGCGAAADLLNRGAPRDAEPQPVVDRAAASSSVITAYLETLQRLVAAPAAEQAEIVTGAQHDYELAPTPSHQLRYALILATPGHAGTDQLKAQRMLREIAASPAALLPAERALASLEMQKVDIQVSLAAENRRLQALTARNGSDKDRSTAALNKRLQSELEENARLRKELEAAQAKLDAVADIERSLSERKPSAESRPP